MPTAESIAIVDAFEEVMSNTITLLRDLDLVEVGDLPTACPGWSVKDHASHMVGLEQQLAGAVHAPVVLPEFEHVQTDLDRFMEEAVHLRRPLPFVAIVDEMVGMLPRRVSQYRQLLEMDDPEVLAPVGQMRRLSRALPMRVFDLWTHEQDIRRAVGRAPRLTGHSASIVQRPILARWAAELPQTVMANGLLRVAVSGQDATELELTFGEGGPTTMVALDLGVAAQLFCGRGDPAEVVQGATVAGATDLVDALLPHLAFTP